jgi:hypothetical protein
MHVRRQAPAPARSLDPRSQPPPRPAPPPRAHPLQCGAGVSAYPWPAESIAEFVKGRTSMTHAAIDRPSFVKSPLFPLFALATLAAGGVVAWKLYNSWIVRLTWLWTLGALAVYGAAARSPRGLGCSVRRRRGAGAAGVAGPLARRPGRFSAPETAQH